MNQNERKTVMRRMVLLIAVAALVMGLYALRLIFLQLVNSDEYKSQATNTTDYNFTVTAARGDIVDSTGKRIATTTTSYNVVLNKLQMGDEDLDSLLQRVVELFEKNGESWTDTLLISQPDAAGNYTFTARDDSSSDQRQLTTMKENLGLQQYATANDVMEMLVEKNNLDITALSAYHIGFVIGPCLNAGGRLQTAKLALRLLLCEDEQLADELAQELKDLNDQRKDMTADGLVQAAEQVEAKYMDDKVLVVFLPDCHESLAGIIAGRLREKYHKPSFVLTRAEDGVKGSGRSIEGYHMFEALVEVKGLLSKFGGHPMAAGLSLPEANVEQFRLELNRRAVLTEEDFVPRIWIDVPMPMSYVTEELVQELELLEPFGQGNEKPQFAQKDLRIRNARVLGRNRNAVKLSLVTPDGTPVEAMVFTDGDAFLEEMVGSRQMDAIYYPGINEYNGNRTIQMVVKEYRFV